MKFCMPYGESIEIRENKDLADIEIEPDEEIEGIHYLVYWQDRCLPYRASTLLQAGVFALGVQQGAYGMADR